MLTALLSACEQTGTGELRAAQTIAGRSVLAWQTALARALGCQRIVCLHEGPAAPIMEVQRQVEAAGGEFHAIRNGLQLIALLRTDDSLLIVADGLVADAALAKNALLSDDGRPRHSVLAIGEDDPVAKSHHEDFERIDAARRWAGLSVIKANMAQALEELPADGDVVSLLLRLSLQAQTPVRSLSDAALDENRWAVIADAGAAQKREAALIAGVSAAPAWSGPARALATRIPAHVAPKGLRGGPTTSLAAGAVLMVCGALASVLGSAAIGLLIAALGAFALTLGHAWEKFGSAIGAREGSVGFSRYEADFADGLSVLALIAAMAQGGFVAATLPVITVGLFRLASHCAPPSVAPFWNDRALHLAVFAICAVYGVLGEALAAGGLAALLQISVATAKVPGGAGAPETKEKRP